MPAEQQQPGFTWGALAALGQSVASPPPTSQPGNSGGSSGVDTALQVAGVAAVEYGPTIARLALDALAGPEIEAAEAAKEELARAAPRSLSSSAIATASWSGGTLSLVMRDGSNLDYAGVPASVFDDLVEAPSAGGYFNANIRNSYPLG